MTTREKAFRSGYSGGYEQGIKDYERYNIRGRGASLEKREDKAWTKFKKK